MQHDQESRTVSLLRDQVRKLQVRLEFIEDSKIFQDLDSPSSFGSAHVSHQAFIFLRVPESLAANRECSEIHERREVFLRTFLICLLARRVLEELHNDSRKLATPSGIQRREGIEKSGSEEPLRSIPIPCFSVKAKEKKSGRQKLS